MTYHALRKSPDGRIEEIRVTRRPGDTAATSPVEHVAYYPDSKAGYEDANASMRRANGLA